MQVNLVADAVTDAFVSTMREGYTRKTGIVPEIYVCSAARGVERVVTAA